jgi:LPXTG-motif cell wall-anchored protein
MKNVFKKTVALVSAMSLMAVGTAVSVSASAEKPELELEAAGLTKTDATDYNTYVVNPGDTVSVQVAVVNSVGAKYDTIQFRHTLGGVKLTKVSKEVNKASTDEFVQINQSYAEELEVDEDDMAICTYTIQIPEEGGEFIMDWADTADYEFNLINTHVDSQNSMEYTTKGAKFIAAAATTPVETTVTTTEATTTEETTTEATTTVTTVETTTETTTEATTTVETTTEATTSVSKVGSSPATGSSSNGVAALAVTMVAAAGAAIALKKKKD